MNSCFYEGTVVHHRFTPVAHAFRYRLFMTYLDLAEIDGLFGRRGIWSARGPAPIRFRRADYLANSARPLDEAVRDLVETETGRRPTGPIRLLTNFRMLGFGMNPVSFYYCFDEADRQVETLVAEVTNTPWRERHCYVIERGERSTPSEHDDRPVVAKALHVSPFMTMDMRYRWRIGEPGERLTLEIENVHHGERTFHASLALERRPISAWQRLRLPLRYPLLPQRIAWGIYWQAVRLWWKGVPLVTHPRCAEESGDAATGGVRESVASADAHQEFQGEKAEA